MAKPTRPVLRSIVGLDDNISTQPHAVGGQPRASKVVFPQATRRAFFLLGGRVGRYRNVTSGSRLPRSPRDDARRASLLEDTEPQIPEVCRVARRIVDRRAWAHGAAFGAAQVF